MQLSTKLAGILLALASSVHSAAVGARHELAEVSVVFFDDTNFNGASYSPDTLVQGVCNTLPGNWLDRPESVKIGPGFSCALFQFQGCAGPSISVAGAVDLLPSAYYDNVESFFCSKGI